MKERFIQLLASLISLARIDPDETDVTEFQQNKIEELQSEINVFHGDDILGSDEVKEKLQELRDVLAVASPTEDTVNNNPEGYEESKGEPDQEEGEPESGEEEEQQEREPEQPAKKGRKRGG